jgi:charged multivesicular body protein 3
MFGWSPQADPKEQVNKWKKDMRSESRKLDRQILSALSFRPRLEPQSSIAPCGRHLSPQALHRGSSTCVPDPARHCLDASSLRVSGINREEEKIKRSIKDAAKRGDIGSCKTYAREIVRYTKAVLLPLHPAQPLTPSHLFSSMASWRSGCILHTLATS